MERCQRADAGTRRTSKAAQVDERRGVVRGPAPAAPGGDRFPLEHVVELIHDRLGFDAVAVLESTRVGSVCRAAAGEFGEFGIRLGAQWTAPTARLQRAIACDKPAAIAEAGAAADQSGVRVGAYLGVPLRLYDGTRYGTLCGVSRHPAAEVGSRDLRFLSVLAELVVADLALRREQERVRSALLELIGADDAAVAYQPIFSLLSGECLGVEALARFPEPFTRPDQTFATAHEIGLGLALEELIVRRAWEVQSRLADGQFLALNLSPLCLLALARRAVLRPEVDLSKLVVEVTEHDAIDAYADLRAELAELRSRGLRLAVDDVGAGYASLRHVLELRPDIVKVDRYLIDGISTDLGRRAAVGSFVTLATDLGSMTVAEGVECSADLDCARELGIHAAQGYLLARPSTDPSLLSAWLEPETARAQRLKVG